MIDLSLSPQSTNLCELTGEPPLEIDRPLDPNVAESTPCCTLAPMLSSS